MRASLFLLATTGSAYRVSVQSDIETPALIQRAAGDDVGSETEVCCLCFDEDGEKTTWDIKTFADDAEAGLQGAGFMDCRGAQEDGTSKCQAHCASLGFQMQGCQKSHGMLEWRSSEHWSAKTTAGENSWICHTDAQGASCECPGNEVPPDEPAEEEEQEETPALIQKANDWPETEVCCLCFDEDGEKTTWDIKTFADDESAERQGAGFMDCRGNQGDGTSKCSEHCASLGFEMKGCMKSAGMQEWRENEFWSALTTGGENSWSCRTDAEDSSCGCPEDATPALIQQAEEWGARRRAPTTTTTIEEEEEEEEEEAVEEEEEEEEEEAVEEEEEEEELPTVGRDEADENFVPSKEVCCLCFNEVGDKTAWNVKTFDDDARADLQGAGFMDCRRAQDDGTSKCEAHCASLGYEMKGCEKSHGMFMWRDSEHWSATTTSGERSWSCKSDADGDSCACPDV